MDFQGNQFKVEHQIITSCCFFHTLYSSGQHMRFLRMTCFTKNSLMMLMLLLTLPRLTTVRKVVVWSEKVCTSLRLNCTDFESQNITLSTRPVSHKQNKPIKMCKAVFGQKDQLQKIRNPRITFKISPHFSAQKEEGGKGDKLFNHKFVNM